MPPDIISQKLSSLRATLRRMIIAIGLLRVLLIMLGAAGAAFILDWYAHLPPVTRISVVVSCAGITLAAVYQYIVRPLGVKLDDDSLALLVEKRHPDFKDRLISAVQLARQLGSANATLFTSSDLVQRVIDDANAAADPRDFTSVLRRTQLKRLLLAGIACTALAAAYSAFQPQLVRIFAARMVHPFSSVEWPRKTTIVIVGRDKASSVAKGDDVAVTARCDGTVPARVTLHYRAHTTGTRTRKLTRVSDRQFRVYIPSVSEDFSFYLEGGDHVTDIFKVKVIDRPGVETIDVEYEFPQYTGQAGYKQTSGQGDITGVAGTKVRIAAKTNKPIKPDGARIVFDNKKSIPMKVTPLPADGGSARPTSSQLAAELELRHGPTNYRIEVTDLDGLADSAPVTYRLRVIVDNPPAVRVIQPKGNREVTANAAIEIIAESTDERDFGGIRETRLVLRNGDQGEPHTEVFADTQPKSVRVENRTTLDLSRIAPKEGDIISAWVEAEDFNDVSGPGVGRSDPFYLTIISQAKLAAKLDARMAQIRKDIEDVQKIEDSLKAESDRLAEKLQASRKLSADDARQLAIASESQRELGKRSTFIGEQFADVAKEMAENKLGSPEDAERLNSFKQSMDALGTKQMPAAAAKLSDAQKAAPLDNLLHASGTQAEILAELDSLLKRLSRTEDLDELIRQAGRLVLKQKSINERSRAVSVRTLGQKPEEITEEDKAALKGLERDQAANQEEMKSLESAMGNFVKNTAGKDPAAAQAVQHALEQAASDQIARTMKDASDRLGRMNAASAVPPQEKAYADLQKLVQNLNEAKRKQIADTNQLKQEMEAAAKQLDRIIQDQQAERKATDPSGEKSLEAAAQQLDRIIREQEAIHDQTGKQTEQGKLAELGKRQEALSKESEALGKQLAKMKGKPEEAAADVNKAAETMKQASETINRSQPGTAQLQQMAALEHLKNARDALRQAAEDRKPENLAKEQERIKNQTDELSRKLDQLAEQSKGLDKDLSQRMQDAASGSSDAKQNMQNAQDKINENDRDSAAGEQGEALQKLEEARKKLDQAQVMLAKKEREKKLFEIGKALVEMLGKQREVNAETLQIDEAAQKEGKLLHEPQVKLQDTARKQGALKTDADKVLEMLQKEEGAVFTFAVTDVSKDMDDSARRLTQQQTDWATQQVQKDIEHTLAELVESLKQEYEKSRRSGGGGGGGGGGGKNPPLVPPLAQLKMLRTLEVNIFETTKSYEEEKILNRMNPVLLRKRVERLGEKQEDVSKAARDFARKLDEARKEAEKEQRQQQQQQEQQPGPQPVPAPLPEGEQTQ